MQYEKQLLLVPGIAFCLVALGGSLAGVAGFVSAVVASLAILLPDLMYTLTVSWLVKRRSANLVAERMLRARVWKFASIVVFLALGLHTLGENLVATAWIAGLVAQVALPPVALSLFLVRN